MGINLAIDMTGIHGYDCRECEPTDNSGNLEINN